MSTAFNRNRKKKETMEIDDATTVIKPRKHGRFPGPMCQCMRFSNILVNYLGYFLILAIKTSYGHAQHVLITL